MPPLRVSRHLRPCHPPGSARQVRCASKTPHSKLATDSHDTPGQSSSTTPKPTANWWSTALSSITSLVSPHTPAPPASTATPQASTVSRTKDSTPKYGVTDESDHGQITGREKKAMGPVVAANYIGRKGTPVYRYQPVQQLQNETDQVENAQTEDKRRAEASLGPDAQEAQSKTHSEQDAATPLRKLHSAVDSPQLQNATLQQQPPQLLQQINTLPTATEAKPALEQSSLTSVTISHTSIASTIATPSPSSTGQLQRPGKHPPSIKPRPARPQSAPKIRQVTSYNTIRRITRLQIRHFARSVYPALIRRYVSIVNSVEHMSLRLDAPILTAVRCRISAIAEEAARDQDHETEALLGKYYSETMNVHVAIQSNNTLVSPPSTPLESAWSMYWTTTRCLVDTAVSLRNMPPHVGVPLTNKILIHLGLEMLASGQLERHMLKSAFEVYYGPKKPLSNRHLWDVFRESTAVLADTFVATQIMRPQISATLSSMIQDRLAVIARDALLEFDSFTLDALSSELGNTLIFQLTALKRNLVTPSSNLPYKYSVKDRSGVSVAKDKSHESTPNPVLRLSGQQIIILSNRSYRRSISTLIDAVYDIAASPSPAVATIIPRILLRLRTIAMDPQWDSRRSFKHVAAALARVLETHRHWESPDLDTWDYSTAVKRLATLQELSSTKLPHEGIGTVHVSTPQVKTVPAGEFSTVMPSPISRKSTVVGKYYTTTVGTGTMMGNDRPEQHAPDMNTSAHAVENEKMNTSQRLTRQLQTRSRSMQSSDHSETGRKVGDQEEAKPSLSSSAIAQQVEKPVPDTDNSSVPTDKTPTKLESLTSDELSEQSLLEELFPEASIPTPSRYLEQRVQYPKIELPAPTPIAHREPVKRRPSFRQQVVESFQKRGEQITVLQLVHCSTELTEADFRRVIPKGKHIESWRREGEFYKIIPGRDPLSMERLPFYYLLFKDPGSALAYQKNASRLHKLSALHQPSSIFSAIPPPKGFLEDGEDIASLTALYNLLPSHHTFNLNTLMQPYHPALRALLERGGYQPIVPDVDDAGNRIWKVLLRIEGHEVSNTDLFQIFARDAFAHGMPLPLRNEASSAIHRLRDIINLKTHSTAISTTRPRSYESPSEPVKPDFEDPAIAEMVDGEGRTNTAQEVHQFIMHRVYNRWVIDFEDETTATRFAISWHRRVLPELPNVKIVEEVRMCNAELLW